jgi:hypothetical protein
MAAEFVLDSKAASTEDQQSFKTIKVKNRAAGAKEQLTFRYIVKGEADSIKYGLRSAFVEFNNLLDTSAPNPITGLSGKPSLGSFIFSWTKSTSKDAKTHEITISDSTGARPQTKVFTSEATTYILTNAEVFGIFDNVFVSTIRFSVKVIDNSGNKSSAVFIDVVLSDDSDISGLLIPPSTPTLTAGVESVEVAWDGKNSLSPATYYSPNIDAVDIYINSVKVGTFTPVYTGAVPPGFAGHKMSIRYAGGTIVQAYLTARDKFSRSRSSVASNQVIVLQQPAAQIEPPTLPTGLSVAAAPFGVTVSWSGAYSGGTDFDGFAGINIYASSTDLGTSTTTDISSKLVGNMAVNKTANKITVGIDALRQATGLTAETVYTSPIYFYYAALNLNNEFYKVGNLITYTRLGSGNPSKANFIDLTSGIISIENLVAGNGKFTSWLRAGADENSARIELSSNTSSFIPSGQTKNINPGLSVYPSGSTSSPVFSADLSGNVTIDLGATATTNVFKVGSGTNAMYIQPAHTPSTNNTRGMWIGGTTLATAPFSVNFSGQMKATQAIISGVINASSGGFGTLDTNTGLLLNGWSINGSRIESFKNGAANGAIYLDGENGKISGAVIEQLGTGTSIVMNNSGVTAYGPYDTLAPTVRLVTKLGIDGRISAYENTNSYFDWTTGTPEISAENDLMGTYIRPGSIGIATKASGLYGTKASYFGIGNTLTTAFFKASGFNNITWVDDSLNGYYNTYNISQDPSNRYRNTKLAAYIGGGTNGTLGDFRALGIDIYGNQVLGPRMFSGSATTSAAINTQIGGSGSQWSYDGDLYFSTA